MKKMILILISILVLVFLLLNLYQWIIGEATYSNRIYRIFSGAPVIKVQNKELQYEGAKDYYPDDALIPYRTSDDGIQLFKAGGIPDDMKPPWIYVKNGHNKEFRFKFPREYPWRLDNGLTNHEE